MEKTTDAVFYTYIGFFIGDIASGLLSHFIQSRKKVINLFIFGSCVSSSALLLWPNLPLQGYYIIYVVLGFFGGFWAVFITVAAEQFGTNLRATVATSVPNFIRGSVPPMTIALQALTPKFGLLSGAMIIILCVSGISFLSLSRLKECFHKDLDFYES